LRDRIALDPNPAQRPCAAQIGRIVALHSGKVRRDKTCSANGAAVFGTS
jgi:hypothetical protein